MKPRRYPLLPDSGSCRLCNATAHQREYWRECLLGTGQTLRRCAHCGAVYLGPDFTEEALSDFYATAFRQVFLEGSRQSSSGKRLSTLFKQRGDDGYAAQRLALLAPFMPRKGGVFELGSGSGAFLGMVARFRPDLHLFACEPDEDFRALRLGEAKVQFIPWGKYPEEGGKIQLIAAFHTLEHLQDVSGFLHQAMRTLQPGGHLALEVPDVLSDWKNRSYVHPAHLTYFSAQSLQRVLSGVGFEIVSCGPHPAKGILAENIWAVARKPIGEAEPAPITAALQEEIAQLDQKLSSATWTWQNTLKKRIKQFAVRMLPIDFLAWLKRKKLYIQRMGQPPSNFLPFEFALRALYGEEGAAVRHEAYFLAQKASRWHQRFRATLALLRDTAHCLLLSRQAPPLNRLVAIVSLARFEPLLTSTAKAWASGQPVTYLLRPDQQHYLAPASVPTAPRLADWRQALLALGTPFPATASLDGLESWTLRCCIARHRLWKGAIKRTLENAPADATLLLHNDFDMFSRAAVVAARAVGIPSVCIQHGLPTDEYFPTHADKQLVWGPSSAKVYVQHGTPAASIMLGTSLSVPVSLDEAHRPPTRIALISQTHTHIYGEKLPAELQSLAEGLQADTETGQFEILLHPEEANKGHHFNGLDLERICRPPHALLTAPSEQVLVIGFCSTAMIDAALAGHYVAAMDWPSSGSQGAVAVGQPPMRLRGADEVLRLFDQLGKDDALRKAWLAKQLEWLANTLSPLPPN